MCDTYNAVVVGGGPSGIAVVGNLLEKNPKCTILWVDARFQGGRISCNYHEISSNTKVSRILDFAKALKSFNTIIENTPEPNAITKLESLNADQGCVLAHAADMFAMLTEGVAKLPNVKPLLGFVTSASYNTQSHRWHTTVELEHEASSQQLCSRSLILCTGSSPSSFAMHLPNFTYHKVELDTALSISKLARSLVPGHDTTVGVIGSSHSAVTVLMNLTHLATTTHPKLRVKWFTRRLLIYAVFMDGWIKHDNTGLKGIAAEFARANLESSTFPNSHVSKFLEKVDCAANSQLPYEAHLPACTHLIQAVGFLRDPLPELTQDGAPMQDIVYNHKTGGFADQEGKVCQGLYGAGIAFPELVTDPAGNVELAVGFWKFMVYLKRVVPEWETC